MQGTRTRTRTHTTPPLQRRKSVAPAGCLRSRGPLTASLNLDNLASLWRVDFRAGGQHGQISTPEAQSS
ncbi:hypothetical protein GCM10010335_64680 [Streptomyces galbus]|nr:hypothetical protein GCM10010335_64680 [Streptomyces galbus]